MHVQIHMTSHTSHPWQWSRVTLNVIQCQQMNFTKINPKMIVGCLLCIPTKFSIHLIVTITEECVLLQSPVFFSNLITQANGWF